MGAFKLPNLFGNKFKIDLSQVFPSKNTILTEELALALEKRARQNDGSISPHEQRMIDYVRALGEKADRVAVYKEIIKAAYRDGKLEEDESDLIGFAREKLKVQDKEHRDIVIALRHSLIGKYSEEEED